MSLASLNQRSSHLGALLLACAFAGPALADKAAPAPAAPPAAAAKMTVTPAANVKWQPLDPKSPMGIQVSSVQGDMWKGANSSFFLKLPAGARSGLHAHTNDYYAVVISGQAGHGNNEKEASTPLAVGSTWFQPGKGMHFDSCLGDKDCVILLIYANGAFDFIPGPPDKKPAAAKAPAKPAAKK